MVCMVPSTTSKAGYFYLWTEIGLLAPYLSPLPDDKILDWSNLKEIADGIL